MPRSRVGFFRNEHTRSTLLDPKLTFWCVSYYLGAFGTVWLNTKLGAKRAKLVQKFVPRSRIGIFRNERTRSTPFDPKSCSGAFRSVSVHLAMFRYYTELGAKWVELVQLMQKFVPRSRIGISRNKHTRSTPLDPKLMFSCVSQYLGAFGNVSLLHETWSKMG